MEKLREKYRLHRELGAGRLSAVLMAFVGPYPDGIDVLFHEIAEDVKEKSGDEQ